MKKRIFTAVLALVLLLSVASSLLSCSSQPPELEGIRERLVYLIEESKELNVVMFGNGLPVYRRDNSLSDRKMIYYNESYGNYNRLMENSEYISIDEIKITAEQIYSQDYLEEVYQGAFDGIMTGDTSAYVRFYDDGEYLFQHKDLYGFTVSERIYDYSTMEIVAPYSSSYINLKIESYSIEDEIRREVYLSFVLENGEWYLDSPTY